MRTWTALCVGSLLFGSSVRAADPSWYAVVLTGDKSKAVAEKAKPALENEQWALVPARGFPRLVSSDSLKGFKPGFFVQVLGFCPANPTGRVVTDPATQAGYRRDVLAESATKFLVRQAAQVVPGTYSREVQGELSESCPLLLRKSDEAATKRLVEQLRKTPTDEKVLADYALAMREAGELSYGEYLLSQHVVRRPEAAELAGLLATFKVLLSP